MYRSGGTIHVPSHPSGALTFVVVVVVVVDVVAVVVELFAFSGMYLGGSLNNFQYWRTFRHIYVRI